MAQTLAQSQAQSQALIAELQSDRAERRLQASPTAMVPSVNTPHQKTTMSNVTDFIRMEKSTVESLHNDSLTFDTKAASPRVNLEKLTSSMVSQAKDAIIYSSYNAYQRDSNVLDQHATEVWQSIIVGMPNLKTMTPRHSSRKTLFKSMPRARRISWVPEPSMTSRPTCSTSWVANPCMRW